MAEGIAFSIVGKLAGYTGDPVLRQIKYLFFFNSNIQNLRDKVNDLENRRNDVKLQVVAADRNAEITGEEVYAWLRKVDELKEKANEVLRGVESSEMGCLFIRCPNLKSRYLLSRRAAEKTMEADKLKAEGKFERVSYPRPPVQVLNVTSHEDFETRSSIKMGIKEALKDKDIGIIGICGMPGVGKTTMANEIVNEVKNEKLFEEVAFAVVSNNPDMNKLRDQLAEALGLEIKEKTNESVRAGRLRQRLEGNNDKGILVVLDDVWEEIDLRTIGIPYPRDRKGLKIMFTTRIEKTCADMAKNAKFKIEVLSKEEGWKLFKDTSGISDDETDDELVSTAKEVAAECGRLPLALAVVGKALKNEDTRKWRDALRQLRKSNVTNLEGHNFVYSRIKLSYNQLGSDEDRDLLLLCSLFAEDESIPIENLVRYARGLELFPNTDTLNETKERAYSIASKLKKYYLLQPGATEEEVKLHDVIRDFCLQMAREYKGGYLVNHAGLKEWPEHANESCSAISITFDKLGQLTGRLKYQNVKLLRVVRRRLWEECNISDEFFKDMKELRVLELTGMYVQIPSSIELLKDLRTLCLIDCKIHPQLSMIGSVKKLEILSFYESSGDDSPIEFEFTNLCNLRSLDLRFRGLSCPLGPGVLSGMKKLEELCLGRYIPIEREDAKIMKNVVSELDGNGFINLKTLNLSYGDFEHLIDATNTVPNGTFGKLESLELIKLPKFTEICSRNLQRVGFNPSLFCNLTSVEVRECDAIRSLFPESVAKCLVKLQSLDIRSCPKLEEVVSADARENEVPKSCELLEFPKLKKVIFSNLRSFKSFTSQSNGGVVSQALFNQVNFPNMETLTVGGLDCIVKLLGKGMPITSLRKLTRINVGCCSELLTIAESDSIQLLHNLDGLYVYNCNALKVLFDFEGLKVTNMHSEINILGRLKTLWLRSLPELVHITRMVPKGIIVFQNLTDLFVSDFKVLKRLFSPSIFNSLAALEDLSISSCKALEAIIGREEEENTLMDASTPSNLHHFTQVVSMDAKRNEVIDMLQFPKLNTLWLRNLSNFRSFRSESNDDGILRTLFSQVTLPKGMHVFENLTSIVVERCGILKYLFSPSMANSLVALEVLEVSYCESIKAIVGKEEEEEGTSEIKRVEAMNTRIVFPKLDRLKLNNLSSIQMFCSQKSELEFPLLKDLPFENCPMMKKLSPWPVSAPKLVISDLLDKAGGLAEEDQVCNK